MSTDTYDPTALFAGDFPRATRTVTLAAGQGELKRGTVLGQVALDESDLAGTEEHKKSLADADDGSEVPNCILAADVTVGDAAVKAPAFFSGEFAAQKLIYGTGHTAVTVESAFTAAAAPIFVKALG